MRDAENALVVRLDSADDVLPAGPALAGALTDPGVSAPAGSAGVPADTAATAIPAATAGTPAAREHIGALVSALTVLDTRLLDDWGQRLAVALRRGGRLLAAGNGASAAQAQQLAAEFTGRSAAGRGAYSAIALHPKRAPAAAIANDRVADEVLARQVRALGRPGDVLLALSTSGRNRNLLRAVSAARAGGLATWCLTGPVPNSLADACDEAVCVYPAGARALALTATVQEAHQVALHLICLAFDARQAGQGAGRP